jgi:hypothetical protein
MNDEWELMCMACGISIYLPRDFFVLEDYVEAGANIVRDPLCTECGGKLRVIGKAGEEPCYRLQEQPQGGSTQAKLE